MYAIFEGLVWQAKQSVYCLPEGLGIEFSFPFAILYFICKIEVQDWGKIKTELKMYML